MSNKKHKNSKGELSAQKMRTHRNQAKRFKKMIEENPNSPHIKVWQKNCEYFKNN